MKSIKKVAHISFLVMCFLLFSMILVSCNRDSEGFVFEENESTATVIGYKGRNEHITIPSTYNGKPVTAIGDDAFHRHYNKRIIRSVTIPDTVKIIGGGAFVYCSELTSVFIPNSVTYIGDYAFSFCNFKTINIPGSVTYIGDYAFSYCNFKTINIPGSVECLEDGAFKDCRSLTTVKMGEGVRVIKEQAFQHCTSLESISLPDSLERVEGVFTFQDTPWYAKLEENNSGKLIYIGKTLYHKNYCSDRVINIRDDTVYINEGAFSYNHWVNEVRIPKSVLMIDKRAFYGCDSLTDVYYAGTKEQWNNLLIESYCEPLLNATMHFNE